MEKLLRILEKYEFIYNKSMVNIKNGKFKKFIFILFIPLFFIFELIYRKNIWNRFVKKTLITNDAIFQYLDNNDFELVDNKFHKIELIEENDYFNIDDEKESKSRIMKYYIEQITNLLKTNINFDIESYLTLIANIDIKYVNSHNEYYKAKVYELYLQSCRQYHYDKIKKYFLIYSIIVLSIVVFIFLFLFYYTI